MPISAPSLFAGAGGTKAQTALSMTITNDAISPTGGALMVVALSANRNTGSAMTYSIADTFAGTGTWTQSNASVDDGVRRQRTAMFYAILGATPGSGTVTVTSSHDMDNRVMHVMEVTGFNTSIPVQQSKTGTGTSATDSLTLDATPAATSLVIGVIGSRDDAAVTAGAAFTELADTLADDAANDMLQQVQYVLASATTTVDWADAGTTRNTMVAIEINQAGAAAARRLVNGGLAGCHPFIGGGLAG